MLKQFLNLIMGRIPKTKVPVIVHPVVGCDVEHVWCRFSGPGRGDCAHFIGLPGKSIPGQHDGPDDTVDVYGIPNGWCEYCWLEHKYTELKKQLCGATSNEKVNNSLREKPLT